MKEQKKDVLLVVTLTEHESVAVASGLYMLRMSCEAALDEAKETRAKEVVEYLEARLADIRQATMELQKAARIAHAPSGSDIEN